MSFTNEGRTFSAMFDNRAEADRAVASLRELGVSDVVMHGEGNTGYDASRRNPPEERGFFESLSDFFFPEDDRASYAEGLHRGGYLVTARNVPENLVGPARDVLDQHGSVDMDAREQEWRNEGWDAAHWRDDRPRDADFAATEGVDPELARRDPAAAPHGEKIDVVEEDVRIGKRDVDLGTVRVRSYVRETPVSEDVELTREHVEVQRRPVDRPAGDADFQDRTIEARQRGEEAVVSKEARVVEEIELTKHQDSRVERVEDTVRKTEVEIDEDGRNRRVEGHDPDRPANPDKPAIYKD